MLPPLSAPSLNAAVPRAAQMTGVDTRMASGATAGDGFRALLEQGRANGSGPPGTTAAGPDGDEDVGRAAPADGDDGDSDDPVLQDDGVFSLRAAFPAVPGLCGSTPSIAGRGAGSPILARSDHDFAGQASGAVPIRPDVPPAGADAPGGLMAAGQISAATAGAAGKVDWQADAPRNVVRAPWPDAAEAGRGGGSAAARIALIEAAPMPRGPQTDGSRGAFPPIEPGGAIGPDSRITRQAAVPPPSGGATGGAWPAMDPHETQADGPRTGRPDRTAPGTDASAGPLPQPARAAPAGLVPAGSVLPSGDSPDARTAPYPAAADGDPPAQALRSGPMLPWAMPSAAATDPDGTRLSPAADALGRMSSGVSISSAAGAADGRSDFGVAAVVPGMPDTARAASMPPPPAHHMTAQTARHVSAQMSEAIHAARDGSVDLTLNPAELGRVRLALSPGDGTIAVTILADRPETLDLMRRHIDLLAQDFRDMGYGTASFAFGRGQPQDTPASAGSSGAVEPDPPDPDRSTPVHPALSAPDRVDIRL